MKYARAPVSVIVVTNNSQKFLKKCLDALEKQTVKPLEVLLIDSGSKTHDYLLNLDYELNIKVIYGGNGIGFCKANNIGIRHIDQKSRYVFFLNPDAFPFQRYIEIACSYLENPKNAKCGAITGNTFGYDIALDTPTEKYDTTGIFQAWYGRWYDRAQGKPIQLGLYNRIEEIPAICGALFFCRKEAAIQVMNSEYELFKESFYMYKEDIELSLRLKNQGWKLIFHPALMAYHCRGWSPNRKKIPRLFRLCSSRNELKIHLHQKHLIGIIYSSSKHFLVKVFDL